MAKKSSRPPASKTASAAQPAASAATVTGKKSSILRAAFSPSEYQLALFASVIQGLDSQHLRIHDIHTGALQCEHSVAPKESITSLDWGYLYSQSNKKRKRKSDVNGSAAAADKTAVLAFGTSSSDVRMYSPAEDKVLYTLAGVHDGGIKDFKFTVGQSVAQGWSIGGDNRLVQWDLLTQQSIRVINIPTTSTVSALSRPIVSNPPVICATQTPIILDVENSDAQSITFPSMTNAIHTLLPSSAVSIKDTNFIAADNARYITVFDPRTRGIAYNLVAEKEVTSLSLSVKAEALEGEQQETSPLENQVLAVVVEDGTVELFNRPFWQSVGQNGSQASNSLKAKAKQMTRKADAILKIVRPDTGKAVSAVQVGFQGPELYIAWAEGGVNLIFERVRWQDQDTGNLVFSGTTEITGRKSASVLRSAAVIEEQQASKSHVNEGRAAVESGLYSEDVEMNDAHVEISSIVISDAEEDVSDVEREGKQKRQAKNANGINGNTTKDAAVEEDHDDDEEEDAGGEPTFGELVQRNSAIDVEAELEYDAGTGGPLVPIASKKGNNNKAVAQIPSGVSLTTVLSQALKTNDAEMLESCFRTSDTDIIRATIQRLNSTLAGTLIQRIAERMASRPGRYGHLLAWVQWTCIAHGGAIAGNAEILKRMTSLYKVMDQRSRTLPSLLLLKGKLDMLDAQINLRQSMADSRKHGMGMDDGELLESVTHYAGLVGGNDDSEAERRRKRKKMSKSKRDGLGDDEDAEMEDEIAGVELGLGSESDEEEGSEEDVDEDGDMVNIEAEESLDGDDGDDDDEEEDEEEEDSDAGSDMRDFIVSEEDEDEEISNDDDDDNEEERQQRKAQAQPQRSSKKAKVGKSRR